MKTNFFNTLFWKLSAAFSVILILLSAIFIYISVFSAEMYFQETRQKLDTDIASHIAEENQCFINGEVNAEVLKNVFHDVMVINPSIEVYLLDTKGNILSYYAPDKTVKVKNVPLEPIERFINSTEETFLMGLDPKNPQTEKAFSAASVIEDGKLMGYIYVILGGEEYENASQLLLGSYILRLGLRSITISLAAALLLSFIIVGFTTRNYRRITSVIRNFKNGDLSTRINIKTKGELGEFAESFNEMADTIVHNIDEIKKMDFLRRELIANVSHDLRTPISIIQGYLETVLIKSDSLSNEEKIKYLETTLENTKRLQGLVEELFELSKLESKQIIPQLETFSLAELLQDIHQKNSLVIKSKEITFKIDTVLNLPMVKADIAMMEKVFQNLLDNSLKFTPAGGEISIKLIDNINSIFVEFSDTGSGIEKDELPHIFERYHKSKRVVSNQKGTGLGLAIVKKILELHGINISVESEKDKDTTFSFEIMKT